MVYVKDSIHPSLHVYLNSYHHTIHNGSNSHVEFHLDHSVICDDLHDMVLTVENFTLPLSYYNVNQYNNTLTITYADGDIENLIIEEGNYDIKTLSEYLDGLGSSMTKITYDRQRNKIFFISNEAFTIEGIGHIFNFSNPIVYDNGYYVFSSFINLSGMNEIHIHSNLSTSNMSARDKGLTDVLLCVPINGMNNELLHYNGRMNLKLHEHKLNHFSIRLTDEFNNLLILEDNVHWTMTLRIDYIQRKRIMYIEGEETKEEKKTEK